jgi:hypothetical protein
MQWKIEKQSGSYTDVTRHSSTLAMESTLYCITGIAMESTFLILASNTIPDKRAESR